MEGKKNQIHAIKTAVKEYCAENSEVVFCYENCYNLLKRKIVLVIEKNFREFEKILRSLEQFIQAVKGQNNF